MWSVSPAPLSQNLTLGQHDLEPERLEPTQGNRVSRYLVHAECSGLLPELTAASKGSNRMLGKSKNCKNELQSGET